MLSAVAPSFEFTDSATCGEPAGEPLHQHAGVVDARRYERELRPQLAPGSSRSGGQLRFLDLRQPDRLGRGFPHAGRLLDGTCSFRSPVGRQNQEPFA